MKKILFCFYLLVCLPSSAQPSQTPADLDLTINYYNRVLTPEGLTRETRYQETVQRRANHIWQSRVLPPQLAHNGDAAHNSNENEHEHFNYIVLPRHIERTANGISVEHIDLSNRERIAIPATEYEQINFDGSWDNAFYIISPKDLALMQPSNRASSIKTARWFEREKNHIFQRVLWDDVLQIALIIESGDTENTFFRKTEVSATTQTSPAQPWLHLAGFANKEYSDFLD